MTGVHHYYRCSDCLAVGTNLERLSYIDGHEVKHGLCGACGGALEYLGAAQRDRLIATELLSPCDHRCTAAVGPQCNCKCGGENHGSGLLVAVTRDEKNVPTLAIAPERLMAANEYRSLVARCREVIAARCMEFEGTAYVQSLYRAHLMRKLFDITGLRSHASRNRKLAALIESLGAQVGGLADDTNTI